MKIFLIRHGQTDYNATQRFQGQIDIALNQTGKAQARALRRVLRDQISRISRIYSSPLCRATETARLIAPDTSIIRVDQRLIEIDLGEFDGRLESDIAKDIGKEAFSSWRRANFVTSAPGGESLAQAMQRAAEFLHTVSRAHGDESIAVVSHQGLLIALKAVISNDATPDSLGSYKQKNDEIEVWSTRTAGLVQQISVAAAGH